MTELATVQHGNALALSVDQPFWNDHQIAALRQLGVDRATNGDLAVFHHVCQRTGLDPFARQIYMIQRKGKQTIQTGIDGYRLVARRAVDRSGEALSILSAQWCGPDKVWTDVWIDDEPPLAARVMVKRGAGEFPGIALWSEYVQHDKEGAVTQMWRTRSAGQLAKCAEALALRKAFPQDLSGVYVEDEMAQADVVRAEVVRSSGLEAALNEHPEPDPDPEIVESPLLNTSSKLARSMFALFGEIGLTEKPDRLAYVSDVIGREITTSAEMTDADAEATITAIRRDLEDPFPTEPVGDQQ